jgi:hypothetical protein
MYGMFLIVSWAQWSGGDPRLHPDELPAELAGPAPHPHRLHAVGRARLPSGSGIAR